MSNKNWFEVSKEGLAELQAGKPKVHILRELIQNAWDENIKECNVVLAYVNGIATISVEDDSPEGFRDLKDSFTLFGKTYKRSDPTKRGRFNIGEKQAFSICSEAKVETTKGTVTFNREGRKVSNTKRDAGSKVTVNLKMSRHEFDEIRQTIKTYLVPEGIKFTVNGEVILHKTPYKKVEANLLTEIESDNALRRTTRKTQIHIHKANGSCPSTLYEIGIPVSTIDCDFSIDVQQKIPLGTDRETVLPSFMRDLYAEVMNVTHGDITGQSASNLWVREALSDERVNKEAVEAVVTKRYGEKVCVANPFDKKSIDEAISRGFKVISGSEMSKEEWEITKRDSILKSSSELFGTSYTNAAMVSEADLTENQKKFRDYAVRIAKRLMSINLKVCFIKSDATVLAQYGNETLTVNLSKLPKSFFDEPVSAETTDLIVHEFGHENGMHTEKGYHELLTQLAGELVMLALKEPEFFVGVKA